jgi:hypothetical protein
MSVLRRDQRTGYFAETARTLRLPFHVPHRVNRLAIARLANVTVLGSGLKYLERAIQKYELKFVKSAARRYASALKTHVAAVTITFTEDKP